MAAHLFNNLKSLQGTHVTLSPLSAEDIAPLNGALHSPTTWSMAVRDITGEREFKNYLEGFLAGRAQQERLTLVAHIQRNCLKAP